MATAPKVWFITGTSKGFGRVWAEAALQRGGTGPLDIIKDEYARRIATWEQWNEVSQEAHGKPAQS